MGLCIPNNNQIQVLAIIGINEYEDNCRVKYLMVGFRSGDINNAIMIARDLEGNPIPNISNSNIEFIVPSFPPGTSLRNMTIKGFFGS
jgi:hypothetical protein